ncbi:hypothetical protein GS682_18320 [Nostoc sp. B(2019)]|nr:hypothetical protein [Nostoc sp. B(2019)]
MTDNFLIIEVPLNAPEADEDWGTKEKFWFRYRDCNDTLELFERIPSNRISRTAIEFAQEILELNQSKLLNTLL